VILLAACTPESKRTTTRTDLLEDSAYRSLRQGLKSFADGDFSGSRAAFDRLLEAAEPGDSQLVFLGVYYGVRSRMMAGEKLSADSVYDRWRLSLPRSQLTEIELVLGRFSPKPEEPELSRVEPTARTLGVVLPLSGKFAEFGTAILEGIKLAVQKYNEGVPEEHHAELKVVDDASDQIKAANLGRELASDSSIVALIGSYGNETSMAISLVASAQGIPLVCPTASAPGLDHLGPMVHMINRTDPGMAEKLAEFAVEKLGFQTFAVLAPEDDYGNLLADTFSRAIVSRGAVVVSSLRYSGEVKNFENQMNLLRRYLPDAIYLPAHLNEITQVAAQVYYYGLDQVSILGTELWNNERVIRMGGEYVDGAVFVAPFYAESPSLHWNEFKDIYESAYRRPVNRFSALGFDSADLLLSSAAKLPTSRSRLAEKLNSVKEHPGVMGLYAVEPGGQVKRDAFVLEISGGKIIPAGIPGTPADSSDQSAPSDTTAPGETPIRNNP